MVHVLLRRLRRSMLCLLLLPPAMVQAGEAPVTRFQITHGPLEQALRQWSQQGGERLLFDARELEGLDSPGLHGTLAPASALEKLLEKLPVRLMRSPSGVYVVRREAPPARTATVARPPIGAPPLAMPPVAPPEVELASVHVTGSRLPRTPLQTTVAVTVIEREDIQRSGYGSLFDLLRHLPGMNGHPPVDTSRDGDSLYLPAGAAATTSLDGMGPRATLFLVNGRRLPRYPMVSLQQGALTDLGGIPLSFVERIELVRGGASAVYGADAIAGVVNIVLREQADGPEALLQTGLSNQNDGSQHRVQAATGGEDGQGGRWFLGLDLHRAEHVAGDRRQWHREALRYPIGLLTHDGYYLPALHCPPAMRRDDGCWYDSSRPRSLQPATATAALYGHWRHDAGGGLHAYTELRASQSRQRFELGPTAAALRLGNGDLINHVFQEAGIVRPRAEGLEIDLSAGIGRDAGGKGWEAGVSRQRSEATLTTSGAVRSARLLDAVANGFIPGFTTLPPALHAELFPTTRNRGRTDQWQAWASMHHELGMLRGGPVQLSTGLDLRHEAWSARPDSLLQEGELALGLPTERRRLSRQASAGHAELGMPLAEPLRLELAARLDRDAGDTAFSPRAGLRWNPLPSWSVLLSSGQGYRAPSLFERRRPPGYFGALLLPASRLLPACAHVHEDGCLVEVEVAENTALSAETSRSHAIGIHWTPSADVSLSLTGNQIDLRSEILALQPADAAWNRDTWQLDNAGRLQGLRLYFDNIGRTRSRNWLLHGDYRRPTPTGGQWQLSLDALHQQQLRRRRSGDRLWTDLRRHVTPGTTVATTLHWQHRHWDSALQLRHTGSTRAWQPGTACVPGQRGNGHCSNPARLRLNLHLGHTLGPRLSAALDIHNLLDTQPVNYLPGNGGQAIGLDDPLGRYFQLTLQFR